MIANLFGEYVVEPSDVAEKVLNSCYLHADLSPTSGTKQGLRLTSDQGLLQKTLTKETRRPGIYIIYKDETCLYVGASETSVANRLSRFVKEVQMNSRSDESHSAGEKYRRYYGEDFEGLHVYFYDIEGNSSFDLKRVEKEIIRMYNPVLNVRR
jgi:hypothetical protein